MEAGITNNTEGRRIRNAKVIYDMEISTVGRNDFVIGNTYSVMGSGTNVGAFMFWGFIELILSVLRTIA